MGEISRKSLFGKLNEVPYTAIDGAFTFCKMRGNPYVEIVHWLAQLVQMPDSDIGRIMRHYGVDHSRLAKDITSALDRLPRGSTAVPDFASHIMDVIERAWTYASLGFGESKVRTGHLVVGILNAESLKYVLNGISSEFGKIKAEDLFDKYGTICGDSPEARLGAKDGTAIGNPAHSFNII